LLGAFLTTYYAFRLIFIILIPKPKEEAGQPAHDSGHDHGGGYWVMAWPLVILAAATVVLGFGEHAVSRFLLEPFGSETSPGGSHHAWLPVAALGVSAGGLLLAWFEFGRRGALRIGFAERMPSIRSLFSDRWYIDHAYRWFLNHIVYRVFSALCTKSDQTVIDGAVDGLGQATAATGGFMSTLHAGMLQYRLIAVWGAIVFLAFYFFV
jgi:NADH-quinone oxidoreductase subunit L